MITLILCIFTKFMISHKFILYYVIFRSTNKSYDNKSSDNLMLIYFYVIINNIIYL